MHSYFNIFITKYMKTVDKINPNGSSNVFLLYPSGVSCISHGVGSLLLVEQCSSQQIEAYKKKKKVIQHTLILLSEYNFRCLKLIVGRDFTLLSRKSSLPLPQETEIQYKKYYIVYLKFTKTIDLKCSSYTYTHTHTHK